MEGDAIWSLKWTSNIWKSRDQIIQKEFGQIYEDISGWLTMYNDMENHLQKLKLHFQKCREYGISQNPNKCAFMVFQGWSWFLLFPKKGNYQIQRKYKQ